ncbi:ABC-three component system protein [Pseudomonas palleroniana]|uniref:ABC-three component systems C-terminal domain-containing protein n=1 Tax=Pseudomonas palleroniana TaxID=191390 RepID=A0A0X7K4D3_9PSED|nr:ABC-three component system protein [Pseudomonas palleroniana]KWU50545.1 hypothetical protein AWV77_12910 [Pseudomonas palleroniana]
MENYTRAVLTLDDTELELFVRDWVSNKLETYVEVCRFSGAKDLGRDVVGFLTPEKHEGAWENYQCKQYGKRLPTDTAICELGKILYYSWQGDFTPPTKYFFVAPKGLNRNLETLIFNPSKLKSKLIDEWDKFCRYKIIENGDIPLTDDLLDVLERFNYSNVTRIALEDMLSDPAAKKVLYKYFGADPGSSPKGIVPIAILESESEYIKQLVGAYAEKECVVFNNHEDLELYPQYQKNLTLQRERFFDADAFKRYYRDNTDPTVIDSFEEDVFHGVVDVFESPHKNGMEKIQSVMTQAAATQTSGATAKYARVPVKQGICHHFVNDGKFKWIS